MFLPHKQRQQTTSRTMPEDRCPRPSVIKGFHQGIVDRSIPTVLVSSRPVAHPLVKVDLQSWMVWWIQVDQLMLAVQPVKVQQYLRWARPFRWCFHLPVGLVASCRLIQERPHRLHDLGG